MDDPNQWVVLLAGLGTGEPTPFDGQYLVSYDPEQDGADANGRWMPIVLVTTPDPHQAATFRTATAALKEVGKVCQRAPTTRSGTPNRPLTAFTYHLQLVPEDAPEHT